MSWPWATSLTEEAARRTTYPRDDEKLSVRYRYGWILIGGSVLFSLAYLAMIRRGHFDEHRGDDR